MGLSLPFGKCNFGLGKMETLQLGMVLYQYHLCWEKKHGYGNVKICDLPGCVSSSLMPYVGNKIPEQVGSLLVHQLYILRQLR